MEQFKPRCIKRKRTSEPEQRVLDLRKKTKREKEKD